MTRFQKQVRVPAAAEKVYAFLADCNHHEQLQPSNITDWSATQDTAQFTIKNMGKFALKVASRVPHKQVTIVPDGASPVALSLIWSLAEINENETSVTLTLEAELNMMMKMLASTPLQKLVDHQAEQLSLVRFH